MQIDGYGWADTYDKLAEALIDASQVSPRGKATKELTGVSFTLENPRSRLAFHPLRKYNLLFAVAEAISLFSPSKELQPLMQFNKRLREFSDDGRTLYGAYGPRVIQALRPAINKIKVDSDTRQAVITINERSDLKVRTKDFPCTIAIQFLLRQGKLEQHVYMRSNDLYWGTWYDVFNFTNLQEVVANELDVDMGQYRHTTTSMHVYEPHFHWLEALRDPKPVDFVHPYTVDWISELNHTMKGMFLHNVPLRDDRIAGPYEYLLECERKYRHGEFVGRLVPNIFWAAPFVERWSK